MLLVIDNFSLIQASNDNKTRGGGYALNKKTETNTRIIRIVSFSGGILVGIALARSDFYTYDIVYFCYYNLSPSFSSCLIVFE